ncbi:MAG: ABC transporter permease [Desulfobacteraceae bacterium]|nr:ABC transporter permease [Desulfobacteraceae bacterium]
MKILKIAIRNITRNKRRTTITVITIVIGVFVIILARGIIKGFQNETIIQMIETRTGDIQIHKVGYRETLDILPLDLSFNFNDVLNEIPVIKGAKEISGRILFSGQIATQEESSVLYGKAIDVEKELAICPRLNKKMYLGNFLTPQDRKAIVLNKDLFNRLGIDIGNSVLLFATTKAGAINATELVLKGVFHSDLPDSNKNLGYIPLKTAQELLLMDGIVTEVALKTHSSYDIDHTALEMKNIFSRYDFEINTWQEIEQSIDRMVENQDLLSGAVSVILFIIVFSTVMNTMLMVVLERTSEIGTLMAIGYKRKHILSLFLLEGLFKGMIGGIIGTVIATIVVFILNNIGIPFYMPGSTEASFIIKPEIDIKIILLALIFSIGAAVLASLYPANRGSMMDPVEALRSV